MANKNKQYKITNFGRADRIFRVYQTVIETELVNVLDEDSGKAIGVEREVPKRILLKNVHVPPNLKGMPPGETIVDGETMAALEEEPLFLAAKQSPDKRITVEEV